MNDRQYSSVEHIDPALMPGRPGYRTRPGRTAYDPFETHQEIGYMTGLLMRKILRSLRQWLFNRRPQSS